MPVIHHLRLSKSNAFLLMGTRPILIDSGSPGDLSAIEKNLKKIGIALADIALLVLTRSRLSTILQKSAFSAKALFPISNHQSPITETASQSPSESPPTAFRWG